MVTVSPERSGTLLKIIILLLLLGVVLSLFTGLLYLFKDSDRQDSKRTLYALGVRITLAAALLLTVLYGFFTGQLRIGTSAPWHDRQGPGMEEPANPPAPGPGAPTPADADGP
jgi:hypothetical protein